jgi:hypothetical protein
MSTFCGNPRRRRRRGPPPQSRRLRPRRRRRRPQPRWLLLPYRLPPQPRPLLPQMHRRLPHRPRRLPHRPRPHLHWLPLQVRRFQRRVATRRVTPLQSRQRTVARRERIAIPGLVAAHPSKTLARASIPAWRGRVPVASAVAPGAVVDTELLPRHLPFLPSKRGVGGAAARCIEHGPRLGRGAGSGGSRAGPPIQQTARSEQSTVLKSRSYDS